MLLPTIQIPELDNKTDEEKRSMMAVYIMQFGNLRYDIALRSLDRITKDEVLLKEFTEDEKKKYREMQEVEYFHEPLHKGIMFAGNKRTWKAMPEYNRPMTPLEEDYYDNNLMTKEEYHYWKWGKDKGEKPPQLMLYDPKTRTKKEYMAYRMQYDY